jgi:preprotein translocase subunit SecG
VFAFFVIVHILICVALILVVLLQAGKGGGLAGAFGGSAATTLFGGRGAATFLAKTTSGLAIAFMAMSILLAILSSRSTAVGSEGLLQQRARERAAQSQLPPSTSTFDPQATDSLFPAAPPTDAAPGTSAPAVPPAPQP